MKEAERVRLCKTGEIYQWTVWRMSGRCGYVRWRAAGAV